MGSRLLPLTLAVAALGADAAGLHGAAFYLVLLAVPGAAAAAFLATGEALEGKPAWLRAASTTLALVLLVTASAVRDNAPHGAPVPALSGSALVAAVAAYGLALVAWLFEPLGGRVRVRPAGVAAEARPERVARTCRAA